MQKDDKTYTIAIMSGSIQSDYVQEMKRGFCEGGRDYHVNTVFFTGSQIPQNCTDIIDDRIVDNCKKHFSAIYQYVHFIKPDAIIITYGSLSSLLINQTKEEFFNMFNDIPCLMIEDEFPELGIPSITADNYGGIKTCVEHLIVDHGFKKISYLSGPKDNYDAKERLKAYLDTMDEYHLPVTDGMVAYGEFSEYLDEQVLYLLKQTPDIEAIVCADDMIAKGCYRVCESQNLVVGKDIAITGFDDSNVASSMKPPLTSISQNVFEIGYYAISQAVAMCRGEKIHSVKVPTTLRKRASCSCHIFDENFCHSIPKKETIDYLTHLLKELCPRFFEILSHRSNCQVISDIIYEYCSYITEHVLIGDGSTFSMKSLQAIFKKLLDTPLFLKYHLLDGILQFLSILKDNVVKNSSAVLLENIIENTQTENLKYNIRSLEQNIFESSSKNWFIPLFMGTLIKDVFINNPEELFINIMKEMQKLSFNKCYFLLFDDAPTLDIDHPMQFPDHMHLVAYFNEKEMKFVHREEKSRITYKNGFSSILDGEDPSELSMVILFSDQKQYGLLLCDISDNDIGFVQICGIQLGSLLNFIELNNLEQKVQNELQSSLKVIQEQNEILDYLSKYDELTSLYNRRGFISEVIPLYKKSKGKKGFIISGDIDHLKEINDTFGHFEGDYAIKTAAQYFKKILPDDSIIGRIGGDEFIAFIISDEKDFSAKVTKSYHQYSEQINHSAHKPYYVEVSFGIYEFICDPDIDFDDLLKKSDKLLYKEKEKRRISIIK